MERFAPAATQRKEKKKEKKEVVANPADNILRFK